MTHFIPILGFLCFLIPHSFAQVPPKDVVKTATETLAKIQWSTLHQDASNPCSFWSLESKERQHEAQKSYKGIQGLQQLKSKLEHSMAWFKTPSGVASFHGLNKAFIYLPSEKKMISHCIPPLATSSLEPLIAQTTAGTVLKNNAWEKHRRRLTFYPILMPTLFARIYHAFLTGDTQRALNQWAPVATLTGTWLKEASTPDRSLYSKRNAESDLHQIEQQLQIQARDLLTLLNRLRPDLSSDKENFMKTFQFEAIFEMGARLMHYSHTVSLWTTRLLNSPERRFFDRFLEENKDQLKACCFKDNDFKDPDHFKFNASPQLPIPPPL